MKVLIALIFCQLVQAQTNQSDLSPDLNMLKQEGQLVSIQIALGEPLRIFVVGREEAKIDFSDLKLIVKRLDPYPGKILKLTKNGEYFAVSENMTFDNPTRLEVKTKIKNKEETFRFNIQNKLQRKEDN